MPSDVNQHQPQHCFQLVTQRGTFDQFSVVGLLWRAAFVDPKCSLAIWTFAINQNVCLGDFFCEKLCHVISTNTSLNIAFLGCQQVKKNSHCFFFFQVWSELAVSSARASRQGWNPWAFSEFCFLRSFADTFFGCSSVGSSDLSFWCCWACVHVLLRTAGLLALCCWQSGLFLC